MDSNVGETVNVFVRVRPDLINEGRRNSIAKRDSASCICVLDEISLRITPPDGSSASRKSVSAVDDRIFTYNKVFPESSTQDDIYESVTSNVKATVRGYNTTIFAYGSTGSGKSYSMTGTMESPGIIPRAISEIFSIISSTADKETDVFFYVRLSYVELYNNNFRNLLDFASKELAVKEKEAEQIEKENHHQSSRINSPTRYPKLTPSHRSEKIEVRESQAAGVFLSGPHLRIPVTTAHEAFQMISRGNKQRAVGATNCNDLSSRSHAILTVHVESRVLRANSNGQQADNNNTELRLGKMHLVDLAGSERLDMSGAEGDTLVETQNINLSLTALGDVLDALSKNATIMNQQLNPSASGSFRRGSLSNITATSPLLPVPYRNSKLTHLLKDSLGGNSKTTMIATIRNASEYYQQTIISLRYASRANKIQNRSAVNRNVIGDTGIHAVTTEIERLRNRLDSRTREFDLLKVVQLKDEQEKAVLKAKLLELNAANNSEKVQLESQMKNVIHGQAGQLEAQKMKISTLQRALEDELSVSQNLIAEQEREIKWLKGALDESAVAIEDNKQAAAAPLEQLQRMQRVVDAWQAQAQNSQKELNAAIHKIEELRSQNSSLSGKLSMEVDSRRQLSEELNERSQDWLALQQSLQGKIDQEESRATAIEDKFQSKLATFEEASAAFTSIKKELQQQVVVAQQQKGTVEAALSRKTNELSSVELAKKETEQLLQKQFSSLELRSSENLQELQKQLQEADKKLAVSDDQIKRAQLLAATAQNELAVCKVKSDSLVDSLSQKATQFQEMNKKLEGDCRGQAENYASQLEVRANDFIQIQQKHASTLHRQQEVFEQEMEKEKQRYELLATVKKQEAVSMESSHDQFRKEQADQLQQLSLQLKEKEAALLQQHNEHELKLQQVKEVNENELKAMQEKCDENVSVANKHTKEAKLKYQQQMKNTINAHKQKTDGDCAAKLEEMESQQQQIMSAHEKSLTEMQANLQAELTRTLSIQEQQLTDSHSVALMAMKEECDLKWQQKLKDELANATAKQQADFARQLEIQKQQVDQMHQVDVRHNENVWQEKWQKKLDSELLCLTEKHHEEVNAKDMAVSKLQQSLVKQIADLSEHHNREKDEMVKDQQQRMEKDINMLVQQKDREFSTSVKELENKHERLLMDQLSQLRQELSLSHVEQLESKLKECVDHQQELAAHASKQAAARAARDMELSCIQRFADDKTDSIACIHKEYQQKLQETNDTWSEEMKNQCTIRCDLLRKELTLEHRTNLMQLERDVVSREQLAHSRALENAQMQQEQEQAHAITALRSTLSIEHENNVRSQLHQLEQSAAMALSTQKMDLEEESSKQLLALEKQLATLKDVAQKTELQLRTEMSDNVRKMEDEQKARDAQLTRNRQVEQQEASNASMLKIKTLTDKLKEEGLSTMRDQQRKHEHVLGLRDAEVEQLKKDLSKLQQDNTERNVANDLETLAINTKWKAAITALEEEKDAEHKAAVRQLTDSHNMDIERMVVVQEKAENRHKAEVQHLETCAAEELKLLRNTFEGKVNSVHADELSLLKKQHDHELQRSIASKNDMEKKLDLLSLDFNNLTKKHQDKLDVLVAEHSSKMSKLVDDNASNATHLMDSHKNEIASITQMHEEEIVRLNVAKEQLLMEHEAAIEYVRESVQREAHSLARVEISDAEEKHIDELRILRLRQETRIQEYDVLLEKANGQVASVQEKFQQLSLSSTAKTAEQQELYHHEMDAMRSQYTAAKDQLREDIESAAKQSKEGEQSKHREALMMLQTQLQETLELHQYELAEIVTTQRQKEEELVRKFEASKMEWTAKLESLEQVVEDRQNLHAMELQQLDQQYKEDLHKQQHQQQEQLFETQRKHEVRVAHLQQETNSSIATLQHSHEEEIEQFRVNVVSISDKYKALLSRSELSAQEQGAASALKVSALEQQNDEIQQQWGQSTDDMRRSHEIEMENLKKSMDVKVAEQLQQKDLEYVAISEKVLLQHEKEKAELSTSESERHSRLEQQHASDRNQWDQQLSSKEHELNQLVSAHMMELTHFNATAATKQAEYTDLLNDWERKYQSKEEQLDQLRADLDIQMKEKEQLFAAQLEDQLKLSSAEETKKIEALKAEHSDHIKLLQEEIAVKEDKFELDTKKEQELHARQQLERKSEFDDELQRSLSHQHDDLQAGYLGIIQQQVESLMQVVMKNTENSKNHTTEDMYSDFLHKIQGLPSAWKDQYGAFPSSLGGNDGDGGGMLSPNRKTNPVYESMVRWTVDRQPQPSYAASQKDEYELLPEYQSNMGQPRNNGIGAATPHTPIRVLKRAEQEREKWILSQQRKQQAVNQHQTLTQSLSGSRNAAINAKLSAYNNQSAAGSLPKPPSYKPSQSQGNRAMNASSVAPNSPKRSRTSPSDQLISALLDGDVQGIRAVIHTHSGNDASSSHGNNKHQATQLASPFWKDICHTLLPLHRAISGLHYHGSESRLVNTLDVLATCGASMSDVDDSGNNAVHKALHVCTSNSVVAVVDKLLGRGCSAITKNREHDTPLHVECKRVRTASVKVITLLLNAGADRNALNRDSPAPLTPLSLVLTKGAQAVAQELHSRTGSSGKAIGQRMSGSLSSSGRMAASELDSRSVLEVYGAAEEAHARSHGRVVWVRAAHALLTGDGSNVAAKDSAGSKLAQWQPLRISQSVLPPYAQSNQSSRRMSSSSSGKGGTTQLHLLCTAFPPAAEEYKVYLYLITSLLESMVGAIIATGNGSGDSSGTGASALPSVPRACFTLDDEFGRTPLMILCERFAHTSLDTFPMAPRLLKAVLDACNQYLTQVQPYDAAGYYRNSLPFLLRSDYLGKSVLHFLEEVELKEQQSNLNSGSKMDKKANNCLSASKHVLLDAKVSDGEGGAARNSSSGGGPQRAGVSSRQSGILPYDHRLKRPTSEPTVGGHADAYKGGGGSGISMPVPLSLTSTHTTPLR